MLLMRMSDLYQLIKKKKNSHGLKTIPFWGGHL